MGVYRKFGPDDIQSSIVHAAPRVIAASASSGWRSNVGISSSLSLYGGIRSRVDVKSSDYSNSGLSIYPLDQLDTLSIDKVVNVSGSYPATGSIQLVKVRSTQSPSAFSVTDVDWYDEHFNPIVNLYEYYSQTNPAYGTCSYDYYALFFKQNSGVTIDAAVLSLSTSFYNKSSSSLTAEVWVKPFELTNASSDYVLFSQYGSWKVLVTGSSGHLCFSDFTLSVTSSVALTLGVWQHIAATIGAGSASLYVNGSQVASIAYTGTLSTSGSGLLAVGGERIFQESPGSFVYENGYCGLMHEVRLWDSVRTVAQLSASYAQTFFATGSTPNLCHYLRLNDGPLSIRHGFSVGSGAFDYGSLATNAEFINFGTSLPAHPIWIPNDNIKFSTAKNFAEGSPSFFRLVHIPSMFYGRQIATGSIRIEDSCYGADGIKRVFLDDGRGSLYISGSVAKSLTSGTDDYHGVRWNKVGNIFYAEGLIVFSDPTTWDVGDALNLKNSGDDALSIRFDGEQRVIAKEFACRLGRGEANASNNPTYTIVDPITGARSLNVSSPVTYVTAVGLYDKDRKLVAIAKLAQPIRKREIDQETINLKIDF